MKRLAAMLLLGLLGCGGTSPKSGPEPVITPARQLVVENHGQVVPNGSATPSLGNGTDFGSFAIPLIGSPTLPGKMLYTVRNNGAIAVQIPTGTFMNGAASTEYSVTVSLPARLEPGASAPLEITFTPFHEGLRSATVNISSNDGGYTFQVQAEVGPNGTH